MLAIEPYFIHHMKKMTHWFSISIAKPKVKISCKMGLYKDYLPLEYSTQNVVGIKPKIFQPHISYKR
jgi:hypothetical protein